jgi:hypothetical protein
MRRVERFVICAALVGSVTALGVGCEPSPPSSLTPPPRASSSATPPTLTRPPQPVMASPAWGEHVATQLGKDVTAPAGVSANELVQKATLRLWSLEPGSEREAIFVLLQAWKAAPDDQTRGLALALVAVAMVWEPTVEGYLERLTDAYGLGLYAGTVDTSTPIGQAARSIVLAAGGSVRQARDLIELLTTMPRVPEEVIQWRAMARAAANDRRQIFFDDAERALKTTSTAWRLRATVADRLSDIGLYDRAAATIAAVGTPGAPSATLEGAPAAAKLVWARALVQAGRAADALEALTHLSTSLVGVDEPRCSEALFWLAEAQLQQDDQAAAKKTAASLESRPGWRRDAGWIAASLAAREDRLDEAKALLMPLVSGTPTSTVQVERRIGRLALEVAAEQRDVAAFERAERFFRVVDLDPEGTAAARARLQEPPGTEPRSGRALWDSVARMEISTRDLLAVRRAIAGQAPALVGPIVDRLVTQPSLRAARALRVSVLVEPSAKAVAAAAALDGKGPVLIESDLLPVIDALGGAPTANGERHLAALAADPRPAVTRAVEQARQDLRNPAGRLRRLANESGTHDDEGHAEPTGGAKR